MIRALLFLTLTVFIAGCEQGHAIIPSGKTVEVSVVAPLSGPHRAYGRQALRGLEGGRALMPLLPNGDAVHFNVHDDNSSTAAALGLVEKTGQKNALLVTLSGSDTVMSMADLLTRMKLPTLAVIATHDGIPSRSPYLTRIGMTTGAEAQIAASYIRDELYMKRATVIYNAKNAYSATLAKKFAGRFTALGGEVVQSGEFAKKPAAGATVIRTDALRRSEVVFTTLGADALVRLVPFLKRAGFKGTLFLSDGALAEMQGLDPERMKLLNGALIIDHYATDMRLSREGKMFQAYLKKKKYAATTFAGLGFEAYLTLYHALSACSDYDRACINAHLRNSGYFSGITSNLQSIDGEMQRPVFVNRIKGDKMLKQVKVF